jgi:putative glutamine transport system substrate-binding protein
MQMKRFLLASVLVIVVLSLLLTPCGAVKRDSPALRAIKKRGVLRVGVKIDVPKFGYRNPRTGKIDGFEVELVRILAKKILGKKAKLDLQAVNAKTRGPMLDVGEIDMVAATFTITEERKQLYNFSEPYFQDGVGLLVKKAARFKSFKDLNGKRIGVAKSSTTKKAIQAEAEKIGIKVEFTEFLTYPEINTALDSGQVDCFSVDTAILFGYLGWGTILLPERFSPQNYGIATKKGNDGLAALVNRTIVEMKENGQLEKLIKNWKLK